MALRPPWLFPCCVSSRARELFHGLKLVPFEGKGERTVVAIVTEALEGSVSLLVRRCCLSWFVRAIKCAELDLGLPAEKVTLDEWQV